MKNGAYNLSIAPADYPGMKYRGRYCQEHQLVWWLNTGTIPAKDEQLHHINEIKTDNRFENLAIKKKGPHQREHNLERGSTMVKLRCPECKKVFVLRRGNTHLINGGRKERTFCSRTCAASYKGENGPVPGNVIKVFKFLRPASAKGRNVDYAKERSRT